ncbi:hypothetical protein CY652_09915 [Burkholderia sp. WAC0059]|nr:hypothetical protein CY652_09915 [Burkholderia sp. WAC0059]
MNWDAYLVSLIVARTSQEDLLHHLASLPGLNGEDGGDAQNVAYRADDPEANRIYQELKRARGEA